MLSVLWGGSFVFIGVAVRELPSLLIVFVRVSLAAAILLPVHFLLQGALPRDRSMWIAVGGMSILNNVIPFTLIVYGQHSITAGLASVINATTPMFGAAIMALAGTEALTARRLTGLAIGLMGVIVLRGLSVIDLNQETLGIIAVLAASASYGMGGLWAKSRLREIPPVTSATGQLLCSTVVMTILVAIFAEPAHLLQISARAWAALAGLALISTAIAYLIFFRIIARAGASVVLLVTMMIPVSAIAMGYFFLGERLLIREVIGTLIIGFALVIIDGRAVSWLKRKTAQQ